MLSWSLSLSTTVAYAKVEYLVAGTLDDLRLAMLATDDGHLNTLHGPQHIIKRLSDFRNAPPAIPQNALNTYDLCVPHHQLLL